MELTNEFLVEADAATTWQVLTDLERIAPCLPGAQLQEVEGEEYRGTVKVKVGPITAQYMGSARLVERDEDALRAVVQANGRDTRGQGNASATISATLTPDGTCTRVAVITDLTITGKVQAARSIRQGAGGNRAAVARGVRAFPMRSQSAFKRGFGSAPHR
jgi:uncharacterized protein